MGDIKPPRVRDVKEKKRRRTVKAESRSSSPDSKKSRGASGSGSADAKLGARLAFYSEENDVLERDSNADMRLQQATCDELKNILLKIKGKKRRTSSSRKVADIEAERIHGTLQFVTLKKLNRMSHFKCKKVRDDTNNAKQDIDQQHLKLQNLLYEAMHLQREITKCLEFKSKDEEIDLVSLDCFYKEAPLSISKPEVTKKDAHKCTLARLDWELKQRKSLSAQFKEAKKMKDQIVKEIESKEEYLASLQPKLDAILQATKPVQEMLGMPFDEQAEQCSAASCLPRPLYVLYVQAAAYRDAFANSLIVTISGDKDSAKAIKTSSLQIDDDTDSDEEEQEDVTRRGGRKADDVMVQRRHDVLRMHPLTMLITIHCEDKSELQLTFSYMLALDVVTVSVHLTTAPDTPTSISAGDLLSPNTLLSCLYEGDEGTEMPNPASIFILQKLGLRSLQGCVAETGWPYAWLQRLCGLQSLLGGAGRELAECQGSALMQDAVRRCRRRVKARLCLQKQLASLEECIVPVVNDYQNLFPAKISTRLTAWSRITYSDFLAIPYTANLVAAGLVDGTALLFTLTAERQSAKMVAQVVVGADYPTSAPLFAISVLMKTERTNLNDENIRDIEAEVNMHFAELAKKKSHEQLLTNQLQRLLMCFDIYLETEQSDHALEGPTEFARENIFPRLNRGPGRGHAYQYSSHLGFFSHR